MVGYKIDRYLDTYKIDRYLDRYKIDEQLDWIDKSVYWIDR